MLSMTLTQDQYGLIAALQSTSRMPPRGFRFHPVIPEGLRGEISEISGMVLYLSGQSMHRDPSPSGSLRHDLEDK